MREIENTTYTTPPDYAKLLQSLKDKWPSPFVARTHCERFSGGALNAGTLANMDCMGTGPEGAFKIGRKTVYPVENLIKWMAERASV